MALQHIRAVQQHASTRETLGRAILVAIATDIGHNGQASYPSYRTIAERVGCHYNSVATWVKRLADCGDLIIKKDGKMQKYTIPFEIPLSQPDYDNSYDNSYDNVVTNLVTTVTTLSQEVSNIVTRLSQIEGLLSQPDCDRSIEDRSIRIEDKEYIYIHPDPPAIVELKTALSQATKTSQEFKPDEYDKAAITLFGHDATPQDIEGFGAWWEANGFYAGKPAIKSLIAEWVNYKNGVTIKAKQNGNGRSPQANKLTPEERTAAAMARVGIKQ